jgi:GSH-dependent disulfide-bond oxidoreductase
MIRFYFNHAPNPAKVALMLEETGLPYEPVPVDTRKGEQFAPAFMALNPNAKVPVIVDGDATVFDSNAILLYLAEKTGRFLPQATPAARGELLSWLMFVASGVGPFSGQSVHFRHYAPEPNAYAENRYSVEARRHYGILNDRLAKRDFMLGADYGIVDMAVWGWARLVPFVVGDEAWADWPHLKRLVDSISERPAALRVAALREQYKFKTETDDEARRYLFPQNAFLARS